MLFAAIAAARCTGPSTPTPPPPPPPPAGVAITCPEPVTVPSLRGEPVVAVYGQATATSGAPPVNVSCTPISGNAFPVGTSTITCLATDSLQRSASCAFTVTVTPPPRITLTRFVAFGDSMTSGEIPGLGLNPFIGRFLIDPGSAYPRRLEIALTSRYTAQTPFVRNAGQSGEKAVQGRLRLSSVLAGAGLEVLLLMDGANDLLEGNPQAIGPAVAAMQFMVRDAKSRGLRVFVATLPPQNPLACCPRRGTGAALVEPYNNQLRSMAAAENATLVDVFQGFGTSFGDLIDFDGLHPTAAGYQKIADLFFASIRPTLEQPPTLTWDPRAMSTGAFPIRRR